MSNFNSKQSSAIKIKTLCMAALFCALAIASTYIMHIKVMFLTFDAKDAVITIAGLLFGPIYSIVISLVVSTIEFITIGDAGFWGFLMDFLSTTLFSTVCALIYKYKKNIKGAIIGLFSSIFAMTAFMLLFNLFIVPIYTPNYTTAAVAKMVPTLFLPFNLTKATLNSAIVLVLYKPASTAMKAARVLPSNPLSQKADNNMTSAERKKRNLIFSLVVTGIGILVAALCVVVFLVFLKGNVEFGK
ncbi:MAG: ECF transporter S component [Clostridia bacterium]|nr:ECF transporter S component [Clostridia bacterium]